MGYLVSFLASGGFVGFSPVAPGTVGSLLGVGLYLLAFPEGTASTLVYLALAISAAVWLSGQAEVAFGETDSRLIVVDEIVGQWIALAFLPRSVWFIVGAFVLFRALDIWKPWRRLEELQGGIGVVADDVVAGLIANLCLQALRWAVGA